MQPYYDDGTCVIYHADCREILETFDFSASTVTDPPYGFGFYTWDRSAALTPLILALLPRPAAIFGYPELLVRAFVDAGVVPEGWVTWWPTNGACKSQARTGLVRETEHIAFLGKWNWSALPTVARSVNAQRAYAGLQALDSARSKADTTERRERDVWRDPSPGAGFQYEQRLHPNEKPLTLMRRLVISAPTEPICDPFMGSGTTLRAAKDLGRKAIGIEISERYCEIAARRLGQEVLPLEGVS